MPEITLNHLALVVDDLDAALNFWSGALGLQLDGKAEFVPDEEVNIAFLNIGEARLELIQPTTADSGVAKFLAKRGPGMHHICLEVDDLETILNLLMEKGIELINESPRERHGRRYAFVHPNSSFGVLLELYERI